MKRNTRITPVPRAPRAPRNEQPALPVPTADDGQPHGLANEYADEINIEAEVQNVLAELGDDASESKIQVYRIKQGERYPIYVTSYPLSGFTLEALAEDCGGGTFELKVYVPNYDADGIRKGVRLARRPRLVLDGPPKAIKRPDPEPAPVAVTAPAPETGLDKLAAALVESNKNMLLMMERMNSNKGNGLADMLAQLELFERIKRLMAPADAAIVKQADPFELFEKFTKFQESARSAFASLPDNASDKTALLALGRDFMKMFAQSRNGAALPKPAQDGTSALPAADAPAAEPEKKPESVPEPEEDPDVLMIKLFVKQLVADARANNDIEPRAQEIYQRAPDVMLEQMFNNPQWFDELCKLNTDAKLYPTWFKKLRDRVKEIYDADQSGGNNNGQQPPAAA